MDKAALAKQIKTVAFLSGQFKLRSGKVSSVYWDKYRFESEPGLLNAVVGEMAKLLPETFDRLAGLELGGIPLVTALSLKTGTPCLYVRKTAKMYGTCNLVEGVFERGQKVVVIEDVITTGGQVCRSVRQMRELGLEIERVICVIDRLQGGRDNLDAAKCALVSVFTADELDQLAGEMLL